MKTVIFLGGTARSGSTVLDLMLGNDPRGFSLGEVVAWFRPWRTHHFDIKCGCGIYPCPLWERFKTCTEEEFVIQMLDQLDIDFLVDSSKSLSWIIDQNRRLARHSHLRIFNLILYKEPVALYYSNWKRGTRQIDRIPELYKYYREALRAKLPFISVSYDWLTQDPSLALEKICGLIGIPYFSGKHEFWKKRHHHLFGSFGPRRLLSGGDKPEIYQEQYANEFADQIPVFESWFNQESNITKIMAHLKARDARNIVDYPSSDASQICRPMFYYKSKLRQFYGRFFPKHDLDREASLIQDWRL